MLFFTIIPFIEAICLVTALYFLFKSKMGWWQYFIPFLLLTLAVEIAGYMLYFELNQPNYWIFNIYLPIEVCFVFYVLDKLGKERLAGTILLWLALLLFLFIYLKETYESKGLQYSSMANTFASLVVIFFCFIYYYSLLKQEDYIDLRRHPDFWVISGLFIFYFGSMGINLFPSQLSQWYLRTGVPVRYTVMLALNLFLYACWSYAFIWNYRQSK
ncbi:MAG TPA: hypothetical protein VFR58_05080 [Flavisolibacter sp.]|nr:hypothetical protein [Flavisolibacter sp.]